MSIQIDIDSTELNKIKSKAGKDLFLQYASAHLVNRDGTPMRNPTDFNVFASKDEDGNPEPYEPGEYTLDPRSFEMKDGRLTLGIIRLIPLEEGDQPF